ncbi:hypothetical protein BCR34DRAFT_664730 [Clohesyomyces aquaticus]|uniref:Uncharacterized protein n=1 Tax=Clohesyomyces aquaticus TaxID=1231657 RepID=A0A1Y1ZKU6_9PLEO|nr:hypothetical protein BCR34DRAFT_664730 [Clohesyomyces aquaticus]
MGRVATDGSLPPPTARAVYNKEQRQRASQRFRGHRRRSKTTSEQRQRLFTSLQARPLQRRAIGRGLVAAPARARQEQRAHTASQPFCGGLQRAGNHTVHTASTANHHATTPDAVADGGRSVLAALRISAPVGAERQPHNLMSGGTVTLRAPLLPTNAGPRAPLPCTRPVHLFHALGRIRQPAGPRPEGFINGDSRFGRRGHLLQPLASPFVGSLEGTLEVSTCHAACESQASPVAGLACHARPCPYCEAGSALGLEGSRPHRRQSLQTTVFRGYRMQASVAVLPTTRGSRSDGSMSNSPFIVPPVYAPLTPPDDELLELPAGAGYSANIMAT